MSSTNVGQQRPTWYHRDYLKSFMSSEAYCFVLHGDVAGYAYESLSQRAFLLAALAGKCEVVATYNRATGIGFANPSMREKAMKLLDLDEQPVKKDDPFDVASLLGGGSSQPQEAQDPFSQARRPTDALALLERLLRARGSKGKVAVVIDYADTICPPSEKATMSPDGLNLLVTLQLWGMDQSLGRQDNPIFLITRQLSDIHPDLRASGSGYKAIELALPDYTARLEYLQWYLGQRESRKKPIVLVDLSVEEMAQLTAGLNLRHLEDILLLGAKDNGVSRTLVKARKDSIITTEFSEVAEMIEPLPDGFAALGGMDRLIEWSKAEIIAPLRSGRAVDASKGVLLVGPPGTGKCIRGDSLMVTNKGVIPIREIPRYFYVDPLTHEVAGLKVQSVTPEGETVLADASFWWDMGESDTYRINTAVGIEIEGTPEHPLLVACEDGTLQWKQLADIQVGDWLPVKQGDGVFGYEPTLDSETAYIFGLLVGDGNLTSGGHVRLTSADQELVEAFIAYINDRYGDQKLLHKIRRDQPLVKQLTSIDYSVLAWQVKADLIRKGLSSALAFDKTVPITVLHAPQAIQSAFLQGLFDADGCFSENIFAYGTSSEELARQVSAMLWNMGIAHIVGRRRGYNGRPRESFRIQISGMGLAAFQHHIGFRLARKAERLQKYLSMTRTEDSRNTLDRLPHVAPIVRSAIIEFGPSWKDSTGVRKLMYTAANGPYAVTRGTLAKIVTYGETRTEQYGPALSVLRHVLHSGLFFTQVTEKTTGHARVYDLTVPSTHSFVANGLVNHNTFWIRALTQEIGFNAVALRAENVLGGIVGESERKLKRFFDFARALAPVLIFVDELDQSDMSRRGNTSGNPVAANLFNAMLQFMSDETLRGKVIVVFASNRPDLIDPALLRFGRVDAIVPVLLPGEDARREIALAQVRTQKSEIEPEAVTLLSVQTDKYSAADIAAVVSKARKLAGRSGRVQISQQDAEQALRFIRPATPSIADWYTLIAIQACNDAELLPPEYAQMMMDRAALRSKIKAAQPEESTGLREERSW